MLVNPNLKLSVNRQCALLGVERSGLYYKPIPKPDETALLKRIYDIWYTTPSSGYRRVTKVLRREGMLVNKKRIERLMRSMGLKAVYPKAKTSIKDAKHRVYDYLLADLDINKANQAWQVDITYIRTRKGF
ncbi:IS3 family transposase, partial [Corynebacterium parakroppenstedtii]|uniref:IS3 family transposase n=1 Tax=Corynebacterium parakroppenstedtii TaxID=2828363 RepID=UPI001F1BB8E1